MAPEFFGDVFFPFRFIFSCMSCSMNSLLTVVFSINSHTFPVAQHRGQDKAHDPPWQAEKKHASYP